MLQEEALQETSGFSYHLSHQILAVVFLWKRYRQNKANTVLLRSAFSSTISSSFSISCSRHIASSRVSEEISYEEEEKNDGNNSKRRPTKWKIQDYLILSPKHIFVLAQTQTWPRFWLDSDRSRQWTGQNRNTLLLCRINYSWSPLKVLLPKQDPRLCLSCAVYRFRVNDYAILSLSTEIIDFLRNQPNENMPFQSIFEMALVPPDSRGYFCVKILISSARVRILSVI